MEEFYPKLEPLFATDPQLLYDFVYICQEKVFLNLFPRIPAGLSLARLLSLAQNLIPFDKDEVRFFF